MKAARKISTLVLMLLVVAVTVFAQEHHDGNLAERQKAPTVLGGTGLFNTFSTRTLCKGEFNFALFWNNFDRDPGDLDINQVPFNITLGLTNRWEIWVNWITWQNTTSRNPFLLSGYQYNASRLFGEPATLLGPPVGGQDASAAFFPGTGSAAIGNQAIFGGILPTLGAFGAPINLQAGVVSPAGPGGALVRGLGPLFAVNLPSYYPELPFFGEVDFFGFDALGRPVLGPRQSSNGSGDVYVGTKFSLIDANKHWFSMALGGYLKIPISDDDGARARGRTSGEFEYGPILMFGQESGGKRFRLYENIGYIHTSDIERNDVKLLDLPDKLLLNAGMSVALNSHAEFVAEFVHTHFVGSDTESAFENNPSDLNLGMRFFFKNGAISFGGAYRRFLNREDDVTLPVFEARTIFVPPFFIINPIFATQNQTFESAGGNGFVGYFSIGSRRRCPPPPAPTCVIAASPATVNRGERLTITTTPTTPGYEPAVVTYDYRWEVKDASGRPVTVSGTGASVDVPTTGIPCGRYTVTTTVTASVPAVDCPSDCVTTGQTTCTSSFEVTEPPCPSVTCEAVATPAQVNEGDRVTLRVTASGADGATFNWSTSAGTLSSTSGTEVTLDTTGLGDATVTVTVNVGTTRTRCDQPCPGGSCTVSVRVTKLVIPPPVTPVSPCGPIFFPYNSARINNEHKACLDEIALRMQQDPRSALAIDGHRDSSERVGISLTRANNARDYLVNEKGIDSARIRIRNFGDTCPHESGDPNLNRRVEFWILPEGADVSAIDPLKRCASGASPSVITTEEPATSVEPRRRAPRRAPRRRGRRPEPVIMMAQPEAPNGIN
ncbi:MAG TPA: OmpA family protein [Blastocatellia bacterium]|nr:OmpA family protein [Blastocatellia bacterium]